MDNEKPTVLIVDDEYVICNLLHNELSERGYLCSIALDGCEALIKLADEYYDVILLDVRLPGMSGMEVLSNIRSSRHNTAVIMITAVNCIGAAVEAMKLGAVDYIVKPFGLDEVNTAIQMVLENQTRLPEESDYKTIHSLGTEAVDKLAEEEPYRQVDAIARGVEARHDLIFGHSMIVTQETVDIARQLGVPDEVIQRWADARSKLDDDRRRIIGCSLEKLRQNPLAQKLTGLLPPYAVKPRLDESQN